MAPSVGFGLCRERYRALVQRARSAADQAPSSFGRRYGVVTAKAAICYAEFMEIAHKLQIQIGNLMLLKKLCVAPAGLEDQGNVFA
jgi:hypothetical protein